ncbi:M15 family metallopeptidase [Paenibacillus sp. TRM 82003]|nr:M15 family metallopeptidase [Paenibacillus sp. TRM 82003]
MKRNLLLWLALMPLLSFVGVRTAESLFDGQPPSDAASPASAASEEGLPFANERTAAELSVVVNRDHPLPETYVPADLTEPRIPFIFEEAHEKRLLRKAAAQAVERLFAGAEADGIELYGVSGYRSYETQKALYAFNARTQGEAHASKYSAVPGASEHQTGLALDVSAASVRYKLIPAFADTKEGRWLAAHAHEYGFVVRYPEDKEAITGYAFEPWHIRYVGKTVALTAHTYNLALEEMAGGAVSVFSQH